MFRTVTVYAGEKVSVSQNWMVVNGADGEHRLPIEDIYSVVIDNQLTLLTAPFITKLTEAGAHILICNEKHLRNALDMYVSSLTTTVNNLAPAKLKLPEMLRADIYNEEDDQP